MCLIINKYIVIGFLCEKIIIGGEYMDRKANR
jgi:hypothetical protein